MLLAKVKDTGYAEKYLEAANAALEAALTLGVGANGGARGRLLILDRQAPTWQVAAWAALPKDVCAPVRVTNPEVGRKFAAVVFDAADIKDLERKIAAIAANAAKAVVARKSAEVQKAEAAVRLFCEVKNLVILDDDQNWLKPVEAYTDDGECFKIVGQSGLAYTNLPVVAAEVNRMMDMRKVG